MATSTVGRFAGRARPLDDPSARGAVRWPAALGTVLSSLGFLVSAYLTFEHYTASSTLSCPAGGGIVNCLKVTTSSYSELFGVFPVAVLGLVFFAVMVVLQSPAAWRSPNRGVRSARVLWSVVGVGTAMWLVYAELFGVDAICIWCTSVHVIDFLLFGSTVFATAATAEVLP